MDEGVRCIPFSYTGQTVLGPAKYAEAAEQEMHRVNRLKCTGDKGVWKLGGYKETYPDTWEEEVRAVLRTKHTICITDIMRHVVEESRRIYHGTPALDRFHIFHDGLSQWWEKAAQDFLRDVLGFPLDRQLRCEGETNADNRYGEHVVGDSPEFCRGLDSHGFADLKYQLNFCVGVTSLYDVTDPQRFHMGTPKQVESSLFRAWEVAPTSPRIIVVHDLFLRSGRRYAKIKGEGECKQKPRDSQRKSTIALPPIHPHCIRALAMLKEKGQELQKVSDDAESDAGDNPLEDGDLEEL